MVNLSCKTDGGGAVCCGRFAGNLTSTYGHDRGCGGLSDGPGGAVNGASGGCEFGLEFW